MPLDSASVLVGYISDSSLNPSYSFEISGFHAKRIVVEEPPIEPQNLSYDGTAHLMTVATTVPAFEITPTLVVSVGATAPPPAPAKGEV